ncbi:MAG: hypothetical protein ACP5LX_04345 [Nitrososphaeria archaeon]
MNNKEEEFKKIIELPEALKKLGGDPFAVNVEELLQKINANKLKDRVKSLKYESQALNSVSIVVEKQEEWVLDALKGLKIDPQLIKEKVKQMPFKDLGLILAKHTTPTLGIKRISRERIKMAVEYLGLVEPWGKKASLGSVTRHENEYTQNIVFDKRFEEEAMEFYEKSLKEELQKSKTVPYKGFIDKFDEKLKVAFYIAYLSTVGLLSVIRNPLTGETLITSPRGGEFESVAIPFG